MAHDSTEKLTLEFADATGQFGFDAFARVGDRMIHSGNNKIYCITGIVWLGATDEWGFEHVCIDDATGLKLVRPLSHLNGARSNGAPRYIHLK